jgi:hypothetical protein
MRYDLLKSRYLKWMDRLVIAVDSVSTVELYCLNSVTLCFVKMNYKCIVSDTRSELYRQRVHQVLSIPI